MSEGACGGIVEDGESRAYGEEASGTEDAHNAGVVQVRASPKTVLDLNEDCWRVVLDNLELEDQLRLASSNQCIEEIFKRYAGRRYKQIDEWLTSRLCDAELRQLLQTVGENLVTYKSESMSENASQYLCILGSHCINLRNLRMTFRRTRGGWGALNNLTKLQSLHANLSFGDRKSASRDFVQNLKQFEGLRKLTLEASSYTGKGLHALDQLEALDASSWSGLTARNLAHCCQTMKNLRHLDISLTRALTKNNFETLVNNCQQLERLAFNVELLDAVPYELVCQLPKLQHLKMSHMGSVRNSFIEGLINKQGSPLESLILYGDNLSKSQVRNLCNISTLKELEVYCHSVPMVDLLKLKNLVYLHILLPDISHDQLLVLLKGLPNLIVINVYGFRMTETGNLVHSARAWVTEQRPQRGKIKIYIGYSLIQNMLYANPFIEIIEGCLSPILINKELCERAQN